MGLKSDIVVTRLTQPLIVKQMVSYFDDSNPGAVMNIRGWAITLMVKNALVIPGLNPRLTPDTMALFNLLAVILDPNAGTFGWRLTTQHTCIPAGNYPAVLRFWFTGDVRQAPDQALPMFFTVLENPAFMARG